MAAGVSITVTESQLRNKVKDLREKNKTLEGVFKSLQDDHDALNSMWEGDAKVQFDKAFTEDKAKMDKFIQGIEDYCTKLEDIIKAYSDAERVNTNTAINRTAK